MPIIPLSYQERTKYCQANIAKRLLSLIVEKKTNLALSADVTTSQELLELAESLGPEICLLKTHIDIIEDFSPKLTERLQTLATQHGFLLFEDRKFADIGNTVALQYSHGIYRIADWADTINAHCLPGPAVIEGLANIGRKKNRGLFLIAEMSSSGHLLNPSYQQTTLRLARQFADFVIGFITQHALSHEPQWLNLTPGISLKPGCDTLGQQYITPQQAIGQQGTDIIIAGRGIIHAANPRETAREYREIGWESYLTRLQPVIGIG